MEETVPKNYFNNFEVDSGQAQTSEDATAERGAAASVEADPAPPRLTPLELLVPEDIVSAIKMETIFQSRNQIFDGRYDAASVCALLATLEEADLRCLREQL